MKLDAYSTYGLKLLDYRRLDIVLLKKKDRNLFYQRILLFFFLIVCNI